MPNNKVSDLLISSIDHLSARLDKHAGRDKAIRLTCFAMILAGSRLQNRQLADRLQSLAKQLSRARMVGRLFGQPASLASCLRIRRQFHDSTDRVDTALESAVTLIYTVNGWLELAGWLADAGFFQRWFSAATLFRQTLRLWIAALVVGSLRSARQMVKLEQRRRKCLEQASRTKQQQQPSTSSSSSSPSASAFSGYTPTNLGMDHSQQQGNFRRQLDDLSLALLAQLFDLVAAVNGLPERGLLWAGRLSQTTAASLHFLASVIGLYKALI